MLKFALSTANVPVTLFSVGLDVADGRRGMRIETLPAGTPYLRVFQIVGATAFAAYALALCELSIWYRRAWSLTLKSAFDGLIYAALTAGTFVPRRTVNSNSYSSPPCSD